MTFCSQFLFKSLFYLLFSLSMKPRSKTEKKTAALNLHFFLLSRANVVTRTTFSRPTKTTPFNETENITEND